MKNFKINRDTYDLSNPENIKFKISDGLNEEVVKKISNYKSEPDWMLKKRLIGLEFFNKMKIPDWGPSLNDLDLNKISYFIIPDAESNADSWDKVPEDIKKTYEKLGIPEAEKKALAGVGAQYESSVVYHNLKKKWKDLGVIFLDMDEAVKEYPDMIKKYFMSSCVPVHLHKFSALHTAVWSGGTFIYVPKNVKVDIPLQAYFRMNSKKSGQFEHTLIIADEGSEVHYIEGCSSPIYSENSLHAGCVEIHVLKNARVRYSSIENWSKNTFNLNTKRAVVYENGIIEWINGNMGSNITMLYPTSILIGDNSKSDYLGIAFAGKDQNQDTGAKVIHMGKNTSSNIQSKSISVEGGITSYRGLLSIQKSASNSKASVNCDALMVDNISKSNTYPYMDIKSDSSEVAHEATVGSINDEDIFYLTSRGIKEEEAKKMIVSGFVEPIIKALPLEYAVELNRLIELEMEGSLG